MASSQGLEWRGVQRVRPDPAWGRVLDGTGSPDFPADLAIEQGRIAAVGRLDGAEAGEVLDLAGLTVCPGFVDVHTDSDPLPAKILQGVTTEVTGNCGSARLPIG